MAVEYKTRKFRVHSHFENIEVVKLAVHTAFRCTFCDGSRGPDNPFKVTEIDKGLWEIEGPPSPLMEAFIAGIGWGLDKLEVVDWATRMWRMANGEKHNR